MAEIPKNSFQGPLAPKIGLNDNFRDPVPGNTPNNPHGRDYGKFIPVGALGLALLILPLTIQQLSQQQSTTQQASQPTPTVPLPTQVTELSPTPTITVIPTDTPASSSGETEN